MLNIKGLDKVEVLQALYKGSKPLGLGALQEAHTGGILSEKIAQDYASHPYIDYCEGRVIKIELGDDEIDPYLYDRDNGQGAAERALVNAGLIKGE